MVEEGGSKVPPWVHFKDKIAVKIACFGIIYDWWAVKTILSYYISKITVMGTYQIFNFLPPYFVNFDPKLDISSSSISGK